MITICFPVYNGEKYIANALKHTIRQIQHDKLDARILISNNYSDDKTLEICRDFERQHDYLEIFNQEQKISLIQNYNFLLKKLIPSILYSIVMMMSD